MLVVVWLLSRLRGLGGLGDVVETVYPLFFFFAVMIFSLFGLLRGPVRTHGIQTNRCMGRRFLGCEIGTGLKEEEKGGASRGVVVLGLLIGDVYPTVYGW
jgi:hypothetical protein